MQSSLETILSIEKIRVKAHHGWYASERKLGGMYSIDVRIFSSISSSHSMSEMDNSINYEQIHNEVVRIMSQEFKLIEECCKSLWDKLKSLKSEDIWEVQLTKEDVPIKHVGFTKYIIKG